MPQIVCVRVSWDRSAVPLAPRAFHAVHVGPEPGYPAGRKGLQLAGAWRQLSTPQAAGMLILDGDVAIDPLDHAVMLAAIDRRPQAVHTAPVKLWPASTHLDGWVWSHWTEGRSQESHQSPDRFSFCFTYLPRALLDYCIASGMEEWTFPVTDMRVSEHAKRLKLPVYVVGCEPKHLHY